MAGTSGSMLTLIGRYAESEDKRGITGYSIQEVETGKTRRVTSTQLAYLIGKGRINNCKAQIYHNDILFRGVNVAIAQLPLTDEAGKIIDRKAVVAKEKAVEAQQKKVEEEKQIEKEEVQAKANGTKSKKAQFMADVENVVNLIGNTLKNTTYNYAANIRIENSSTYSNKLVCEYTMDIPEVIAKREFEVRVYWDSKLGKTTIGNGRILSDTIHGNQGGEEQKLEHSRNGGINGRSKGIPEDANADVLVKTKNMLARLKEIEKVDKDVILKLDKDNGEEISNTFKKDYQYIKDMLGKSLNDYSMLIQRGDKSGGASSYMELTFGYDIPVEGADNVNVTSVVRIRALWDSTRKRTIITQIARLTDMINGETIVVNKYVRGQLSDLVPESEINKKKPSEIKDQSLNDQLIELVQMLNLVDKAKQPEYLAKLNEPLSKEVIKDIFGDEDHSAQFKEDYEYVRKTLGERLENFSVVKESKSASLVDLEFQYDIPVNNMAETITTVIKCTVNWDIQSKHTVIRSEMREKDYIGDEVYEIYSWLNAQFEKYVTNGKYNKKIRENNIYDQTAYFINTLKNIDSSEKRQLEYKEYLDKQRDEAATNQAIDSFSFDDDFFVDSETAPEELSKENTPDGIWQRLQSLVDTFVERLSKIDIKLDTVSSLKVTDEDVQAKKVTMKLPIRNTNNEDYFIVEMYDTSTNDNALYRYKMKLVDDNAYRDNQYGTCMHLALDYWEKDVHHNTVNTGFYTANDMIDAMVGLMIYGYNALIMSRADYCTMVAMDMLKIASRYESDINPGVSELHKEHKVKINNNIEYPANLHRRYDMNFVVGTEYYTYQHTTLKSDFSNDVLNTAVEILNCNILANSGGLLMFKEKQEKKLTIPENYLACATRENIEKVEKVIAQYITKHILEQIIYPESEDNKKRASEVESRSEDPVMLKIAELLKTDVLDKSLVAIYNYGTALGKRESGESFILNVYGNQIERLSLVWCDNSHNQGRLSGCKYDTRIRLTEDNKGYEVVLYNLDTHDDAEFKDPGREALRNIEGQTKGVMRKVFPKITTETTSKTGNSMETVIAKKIIKFLVDYLNDSPKHNPYYGHQLRIDDYD